MKTTLLLCAATTLLALGTGANAAVRAADVPHITNGGTGYIGLTESAGQPRAHRMTTRWASGAGETTSMPQRAGEASTMVNGRPNQIVPPTQAMGAPADGPTTMGWQGNAGDPRLGMGTPK